MARHFKIIDLLSDEQLAAFHDHLLDRRSTIDSAFSWLRERGCRVSRSTVGEYRMRVLDLKARMPKRRPMADSDPLLRRQIGDWIERLDGRDLVGVGMLTEFLASNAREAI
jgi:hypothetical protein